MRPSVRCHASRCHDLGSRCSAATEATAAAELLVIWRKFGVSTNRGVLFWGASMRDPITSGPDWVPLLVHLSSRSMHTHAPENEHMFVSINTYTCVEAYQYIHRSSHSYKTTCPRCTCVCVCAYTPVHTCTFVSRWSACSMHLCCLASVPICSSMVRSDDCGCSTPHADSLKSMFVCRPVFQSSCKEYAVPPTLRGWPGTRTKVYMHLLMFYVVVQHFTQPGTWTHMKSGPRSL